MKFFIPLFVDDNFRKGELNHSSIFKKVWTNISKTIKEAVNELRQ